MSSSQNPVRLKNLIGLFGISVAAIAREAKKSPAYVSRIINGDAKLVGDDDFWMAVERGLPRLMESRRRAIFDFSGIDAEKVVGLK